MQSGLTIHDALKAAILRKIDRLHRMQCDIADLNYQGFITPTELWLLESTGFMLDFDTGICTDTWQPMEGAQ